MIKVTFYEDANDVIRRCTFSGHADFADRGDDIVCAAVSILFINTMNAIETFTSDKTDMEHNGKKNFHDFSFCDFPSESAQLLMNTLLLGLDSIQKQYGSEYLKIIHKEVQ